MAAVVSAGDSILTNSFHLEAADLLENLSLDSQTMAIEIPASTKKLSPSQYGAGDLAANTAKPVQQSTTPFPVDPSMHYFPSTYLSTPYHGGYTGYGNEWSDYPSYPNSDAAEMAHDIYSDNGTVLYHQGYGYPHFGTYPSPNSPISSLGSDGQLYGPQHYQYPGSFYESPTPTSTYYPPDQASPSQGEVPSLVTADKVPLSVGAATRNPNNIVSAGSVNGNNNGPKMFRSSNQNSSSNVKVSNKSRGLPTGFPSSGYHDPRYGYDRFQSSWFDVSSGTGFLSSVNSYPTKTTSGLDQASGYMNLLYPKTKMYGQYGNRVGAYYGSFGYNSWMNGRGWVVVDKKYKPRGRGYGSENIDGLNELNRGPRAKGFKNQKECAPVTHTVEGHNLPLIENNKEDKFSQIPDKEQFNWEDFPEVYSQAKFFVIKSYSEDDVHKSIKYGVWTSTPNGNKKLDEAYQAKDHPGDCPIFLLFSVNTSGQFVGLAEMVGPVDFNKTVEHWQQDKWTGCFPLKWHIVKDIPNNLLRHITLENNENKPVTNSRDTQEVAFEKGIQILKIFKSHKCKTSILDDFGFYAARERILQERRAKQNLQKQVLGGKPSGGASENKDEAAVTSKDGLQIVTDAVGAAELVKRNADVKQLQEESVAAVENST